MSQKDWFEHPYTKAQATPELDLPMHHVAQFDWGELHVTEQAASDFQLDPLEDLDQARGESSFSTPLLRVVLLGVEDEDSGESTRFYADGLSVAVRVPNRLADEEGKVMQQLLDSAKETLGYEDDTILDRLVDRTNNMPASVSVPATVKKLGMTTLASRVDESVSHALMCRALSEKEQSIHRFVVKNFINTSGVTAALLGGAMINGLQPHDLVLPSAYVGISSFITLKGLAEKLRSQRTTIADVSQGTSYMGTAIATDVAKLYVVNKERILTENLDDDLKALLSDENGGETAED